jgi:hypothetical protein
MPDPAALLLISEARIWQQINSTGICDGSGHRDVLTGVGGQDQADFFGTLCVQQTITDFLMGLDKIDVRQFTNISASSLPTENPARQRHIDQA